ncbi:transposase [Xylanibacter oryzae]|uniref:transposase n=1 Tax=Xylanibacter oryzae TaxID=185293 RepID=UPI0035A994CE
MFERLFVDGIQLITKLKNNMKGAIMKVSDKLLLRKRLSLRLLMMNLRTLHKWNIQDIGLLIILLSIHLEHWLHTAFSLRSLQSMLKELLTDN